MKVIPPETISYGQGQSLPIKMWLNTIEDGAIEQAKHLAALPFAFRHIALMPDCHQGYGMPIGAVLATKDVIVPNAVGVDIGCGMNAVKTNIKASDVSRDQLLQVHKEIIKRVPVGFAKQQKAQDYNLMPKVSETDLDIYDYPIVYQQFENARFQLGTLGGGNHFIEIQKDEEGYIWFMLHSGSRGLGKAVCDSYNNIAKILNRRYYSEVPAEWDLAFLVSDTGDAKLYIREMNYCVDYAYANRQLMMKNLKEAFETEIKNVEYGNEINIPHNYAALESHFGENVWVHRKGAIEAREGTVGIIPSSQGTCSYITKGLGNRESFNTSSHGAGRVLGRKEAIRRLNLETEQKLMGTIIHNMNTQAQVDEAPSVYKNIDEVMKNQKDLTKILVKLTPLAVVKG